MGCRTFAKNVCIDDGSMFCYTGKVKKYTGGLQSEMA